MKTLKLMADYHCYPLWRSSPEWGNVNPDDLPLSASLKADLLSWAKMFDETLDSDNPAASGFENLQKENEFKDMAIDLIQRLRYELGNRREAAAEERAAAAKLYAADQSPQRHGSLIRARNLAEDREKSSD